MTDSISPPSIIPPPFKTIIDYVCKELVDLSYDTIEFLKFFEDNEEDLVVNFTDGDREYVFAFCEETNEVIDVYDYDSDDEEEYVSRKKYPVRIQNAVLLAKKRLKKNILTFK